MIASPPRATDVATVMPCTDGDVLVIPHVLPLRITKDALTLTVAEWLGIPDRS
ncbi:hypothetical protein [Microbispora sp. CA-102843]|uniref:hypothetical protein n=1 Tax=Microbispora sp. CA-102843 TaxID=3239952 RepID=UPI003D8CB212